MLTTSSLAFVNPWFNPINLAAYHPVTKRCARQQATMQPTPSMLFPKKEASRLLVELLLKVARLLRS